MIGDRKEGLLFIRVAPESRSSQTQRIYNFLQLRIEDEMQPRDDGRMIVERVMTKDDS